MKHFIRAMQNNYLTIDTLMAVVYSFHACATQPNHASPAMVRKDMLKQGIELFEFRPDAVSCLDLIGKQELCDEDFPPQSASKISRF